MISTKKIAIHYCKTWFALDLVACFPVTYLELIFGGGETLAPGSSVRDPTPTVLPNDDPNHLGLRCNALPEHQMALITSGCLPFSRPTRRMSARSSKC